MPWSLFADGAIFANTGAGDGVQPLGQGAEARVRFRRERRRRGYYQPSLVKAPLQLESGKSTNSALGWKVESVLLAGTPARLVGHRGTPMEGAVSLLMFPDLGVVVAAASNRGTTGVDPFAPKVAKVFAVRRRGI